MTGPAIAMDTAEAFHDTFARCPATVYVVTSRAIDGTPQGATATSVNSVSLSPPQILVCLGSASSTLRAAMASGRLALHALTDAQADVAEQFASRSPGKFVRVSWRWSHAETPVLPNVLFRLECVISKAVAVADHVVLIADVVEVGPCADRDALVRLARQYAASPAPRRPVESQ